MPLASIPVARVELGRRLREISEAQVVALMASIGDVGLLNPITVYPRKVIEAGISVDGYGVVAGAHRLEACKRLGHIEIAAQVVGLSELERQIAECDENLCGTTLTPSERATFTRRRKEAYEALHPETRHGANQHTDRTRKVCDSSGADRFTADTAARTGQSERKVQLDAERGSKVCDDAMALIRGTRLDTGVYLDQIKKLDPAAQVERVTADLKPKPQKPVDLSGVRRSKIDADVKDRAAREVAEIIAEHVPADLWDGVKANLYAAGANSVAHALTNITCQSLMDKGGWG